MPLLVFVAFASFAQVTTKSHRMDRELHLSYDNDLFFATDQYYTSGVNITHARIIDEGTKLYSRFKSKRNDTLKVIGRIQYGHKIFTPSKIKKRNVNDFDRPYAGWHYLKFHVQNHPGVNSMNRYTLTLGVVGDRSGIGNFQEWWHDKFGFPQPRGWKYQIRNEFILNFDYNRMMYWSPIKNVGFLSDTGIKLGNGITGATQHLQVRYGRSGRLFNSGAGRSRISKHIPVVGNNDPEEEEGYFFYGFEGQYVLSNIFIEGTLIGENRESPHVEELETFVIVRKYGFTYTNYYTTFSFTVYKMTPENEGAKTHRYVSLNLAFRF